MYNSKEKKKDRHAIFLPKHVVHFSNVIYEDVRTDSWPQGISSSYWHKVKDTLALALLLAGKERTQLLVGLCLAVLWAQYLLQLKPTPKHTYSRNCKKRFSGLSYLWP